jgi:hypothetical protein
MIISFSPLRKHSQCRIATAILFHFQNIVWTSLGVPKFVRPIISDLRRDIYLHKATCIDLELPNSLAQHWAARTFVPLFEILRIRALVFIHE